MGRAPSVHDEQNTTVPPGGRYSTGLCRIWVQNLLICTQTEGDTVHHGHTELDLRDPTTQAWAMGPVAHARDLGPRSD